MAKSNPVLLATVSALKQKSRDAEAGIWRDVAQRLERPSRNWAQVNVSRIERYVNDGEVALVPGVLLAAGTLTKKVDVAAFRISKQARDKITARGGRCLTIQELANENPKGANVRIIG